MTLTGAEKKVTQGTEALVEFSRMKMQTGEEVIVKSSESAPVYSDRTGKLEKGTMPRGV